MNTVAENERAVSGHNEAARMRSFLERQQRLAEDKKAIGEDIKEVWAEARGEGYDVPVLKRILKAMGEDPAKRENAEAIFQLYCETLGVRF